MKPARRLNYAGTSWSAGRRGASRANRFRQPPAWRRLEASVRGHARPQAGPLLNPPLRWLVTAVLVGISLAVLGKEPALRDEVAERVAAVWEAAGEGIAAARPAARPAAPATRPWPAPAAGAVRPAAKPLALISDSGVFVLGADGGVTADASAVSPDRFPVVTGAAVDEVPGPGGVSLRTRVDVALIRTILAAPFADQLSEIHLGENGAVTLYLRDAAKIKLENGPNLERDLRRLGAVLADLRARGLAPAVIDLRFLQQAVIRVRGARTR